MMKRSLTELDIEMLCRREFYPSPAAWEDQVLYFLMLDRFSDGNENGYLDNDGRPVTNGHTGIYRNADAGNATRSAGDRENWFKAGGKFVGGTLKISTLELETLMVLSHRLHF